MEGFSHFYRINKADFAVVKFYKVTLTLSWSVLIYTALLIDHSLALTFSDINNTAACWPAQRRREWSGLQFVFFPCIFAECFFFLFDRKLKPHFSLCWKILQPVLNSCFLPFKSTMMVGWPEARLRHMICFGQQISRHDTENRLGHGSCSWSLSWPGREPWESLVVPGWSWRSWVADAEHPAQLTALVSEEVVSIRAQWLLSSTK